MTLCVSQVQQGALDEMQGLSSAAIKKYKRAYRVFEQLSLEDGVDEHDKNVLRQLTADIWTRVDAIQSKNAAAAASVSGSHSHTATGHPSQPHGTAIAAF